MLTPTMSFLTVSQFSLLLRVKHVIWLLELLQ